MERESSYRLTTLEIAAAGAKFTANAVLPIRLDVSIRPL
jgi:hypothetical protein